MAVFITRAKSPSVKTVTGRVKNRSTGRKKVLRTPRTIATMSAVVKFDTRTPGVTYPVTKTAIVLKKRCKIVTMFLL